MLLKLSRKKRRGSWPMSDLKGNTRSSIYCTRIYLTSMYWESFKVLGKKSSKQEQITYPERSNH